jgi:hypothetical protein
VAQYRPAERTSPVRRCLDSLMSLCQYRLKIPHCSGRKFPTQITSFTLVRFKKGAKLFVA